MHAVSGLSYQLQCNVADMGMFVKPLLLGLNHALVFKCFNNTSCMQWKSRLSENGLSVNIILAADIVC